MGHNLGAALQQELERAHALVVLVTPTSLGSFWVGEEIAMFHALMAHDRSRLLVPVRIAPCELPALLAARWWVDALAQPFEQVIEAIAAALVVTDDIQDPPRPPQPPLPPLGSASVPAGATPTHHLTPMPLYNLGFRGYTISGVECILPPLCPVPGGVFTMGSDKAHDKEADDDETPQYPIEVGPFALGQHPVTVAEYACAVRAKAVREPPKGYLGTDWQKQLTRLDHPVVCVSWEDALAYVRWLAQTTGQPWHLPSEAEWEKAARWDATRQVSRIYPWGDTFDKSRCNTDASGIKTTTPVGRYPTGASPCGAQDIAGNVWEWTSSLITPYAYKQNDGRENLDSTENRVLRGGSWYSNARDARAAYRNHFRPDRFSGNDGFRSAWVPVGL